MALMGVKIDKRVIATGITFGANVSYAHGLGAAPDAVLIRYRETIAPGTSWYGIVAAYDTANVTLQNMGNSISPTLEVCAVRFHSIIQ